VRKTKLLEAVLDVSRIISGKLALNLGPTRVASAVLAAIETVTPAAVAKDIAIDAVADDSPVITADVDRMQQIVWNLPSNAVKFTPKGGRVSVQAYREGPDVCITGADGGGDTAGGPAPRLRSAPASGRVDDAASRRPRVGTRHREATGHGARRVSGGAERRDRPGRQVRRTPAGAGGGPRRGRTPRSDATMARLESKMRTSD
jgi:hypothetical protein